MRFDRTILTTAALALGLSLGGCESFDLESIWSTKKPLPGDRRAVFPQGVPGVAQGVPPELVQGYQPPAEPEPQALAAPVEKPKPKAKPKPRPRQVAAPAQQPSSSAVQPASQQPSQVQWPEPPRAGSQQATTPWPDPPAPSR
jgi:hypothetical protein